MKLLKLGSSGISSVTIFSRGDGYKVGDTLSLDAKGTNGSGANIVISELLGKDVDTVEIGVSTFINTTLRLNKRNNWCYYRTT